MADARPAWQRVRRWVAGSLAGLLIAAATAMSLGQLLLPVILQHPARIAALMSSRLGQPVRFPELAGEWQPSGPLLTVRDLEIGSGSDAVHLPAAQLKVDFGAWLSPTRRWLELRVSGVTLQVTRTATGQWQVAGLGRFPRPGAAFDGKLPVDLGLHDLRVVLDDEVTGHHATLHASRLRLIGRTGKLQIAALLDGAGTAPLRVVARIDPLARDAHLYLAGKALDLPAWADLAGDNAWQVRAGSGDIEAWVNWSAGAVVDASAELKLQDVALAHGVRGLQLAAWQGNLFARRDGTGWRMAWQGAQAGEGGSAWLTQTTSGAWQASADAGAIDLAAALPWLQLLPAWSDRAAAWLRAAAPSGYLRDVHFAWQDAAHYRVRATLDGIGFAAAHGIPGVDHLSGTLSGDGDALGLSLPPQALTVRVPGVFRKPFVYSQAGGDIVLWRAADGWRVGTDRVTFDGEGYSGTLRGQCTFRAEGAPILDVAATVDHAEAPAAKLFWPVNVMPAAAVTWLDRALISGQVTGRAIFRGPLDAFPFPDGSGRFEAIADLSDATLDFDADWPRAEGLHGEARFVDNGMDVTIDAGSSLGVPADRARGRIEDFDRAVLQLEVGAHGDAGRMLAYLRKTPVGKDFGDALAGLTAAGPASAGFSLTLPLDDAIKQAAVLDGNAKLDGVDFGVPEWALKLGKLKGALHFGVDSLDGAGIAARYGTQPVTLAIRVGSAVKDKAHQLEADLAGRLDVATVAAAYPSLRAAAQVAKGNAAATVGLSIDDTTAANAGRRLTVDSDLVGVALNLPAPLAKPVSAALPLHLDLPLPFAGKVLAASLGDIIGARILLPAGSGAAGVDVALGGAAQTPVAGNLRVHGHAAALDLGGWSRLALADAAGSGLRLASLDVATDDARLDTRGLGPLHVVVMPEGAGFRIDLDGVAATGRIDLPLADLARRGVTARLDQLHWPASKDDAADTTDDVAPAALPPLHVLVQDLRLGAARLGEVRFEAVPITDGMQIEQFDAQSKDMRISARGRWTGVPGATRTQLAIDFSAANLGRMLDAFGYKGLVAGGHALAHIEGSWAGSPSGFSLAALDGSMKIQADDGRILEVDPGVGRLFGLFSIRELPRRLSLDFGDIFESGFAFNRVTGDFNFIHGDARTDDLTIEGPAALIKVSGRTGLKSKDYDQDIIVTPHVGVALPVVGAIAGGPVGAAAGLAVQGLLGKGLNRAAAKHYRVTGPWDKPKIDVIQARPQGHSSGSRTRSPMTQKDSAQSTR